MSAAKRSVRESQSASETEALASAWAGTLRAGDVVLLSGELGAGKTTFVRAACRALGLRAPVSSPTFTIGRRYTDGPIPVSHVDLYRLGDPEQEEDPDLLADYVSPDTIAFVEWPDGARTELARLGSRLRHVRLEHAGGDRRRIELD